MKASRKKYEGKTQRAVKEPQAGGHEHNQDGAKDHKTGVTGVEVKHEILQEKTCDRNRRHGSGTGAGYCRSVGNSKGDL